MRANTATAARLTFEGVSRRFETPQGTIQAVAGISLDLEPGSFTALVGPSGCGKSTLLHIAAGLDTQYEGAFRRTPADAQLACLFQSPRLLPWLSARKNVSLILEASIGLSNAEARERAESALVTVGLNGFTDRFPGELSGGMQQRVSLARALAVDPAVLLMDEPFSALDQLTARRLREELLALCARTERTILFVTHDIHEACYLAKRVVVMSPHPGSIVAELEVDLPSPRDYEDPRLAEAAGVVLKHIDVANESTPPREAA